MSDNEPTGAECTLCKRPIMQSEWGNAWKQLSDGYTEKRTQGGSNAVRLPAYTGRFAHKHCIDAEVRHGGVNQGSLLV